MKNCIFCGKERDEYRIYESKNFLVRIGIGLIAPGHIMLITRDHLPCFGVLPKKLQEEFLQIKRKMLNALHQTFGSPFQIEYGIWGQTVSHAHIHFIPLQGPGYYIKSIIKEMVEPGNIKIEEVNHSDLRKIFKKEGGYVTIEEDGRTYACHTYSITDTKHPNLGYRVFFTQQKGLQGVSSWKDLSPKDKERDQHYRDLTREKLYPLLNDE